MADLTQIQRATFAFLTQIGQSTQNSEKCQVFLSSDSIQSEEVVYGGGEGFTVTFVADSSPCESYFAMEGDSTN